MRQLRKVLVVLAAGLALGACGVVYRQDINQGNLMEQDMVDALKPGMTKRQVALVMGTPSIASPFDQDRWDYASSFSRRGRAPEVKNLTLFFENNVLVRMEGDYSPQQESDLLDQSRRIRGRVDEDAEAAAAKPKEPSGG
jgi:outer membrane protein assembly factor BamE